jgi:hypothetical protein
MRIYHYLHAKIGVDTAENGPPKSPKTVAVKKAEMVIAVVRTSARVATKL